MWGTSKFTNGPFVTAIPGHIHYLRFCRRGDIEMSIWNNCSQVEDFNTKGRNAVEPCAGDTFMIAKRWMADREVLKVKALFPAAVAQQVRTGFHLPEGLATRRAISPQVSANILRYAPRSMKTGELPQQAGKYLLDWCKGDLVPVTRPSTYSVLGYRLEEFCNEDVRTGSWSKPSRLRHIDLTIAGPDAGSSESESEGEVELPQALAGF